MARTPARPKSQGAGMLGRGLDAGMGIFKAGTGVWPGRDKPLFGKVPLGQDCGELCWKRRWKWKSMLGR